MRRARPSLAVGMSVGVHVLVLGLLASAHRAPSVASEPSGSPGSGSVVVIPTQIVEGGRALATAETDMAAGRRAGPVPAAGRTLRRAPRFRSVLPLPVGVGTTEPAGVAPGALATAETNVAAGPVSAAGRTLRRAGVSEAAGDGTGAGTNLGTGTADADLVRQAIQNAIRYPRLARRRGIVGRVTVRFFIDDGGAPIQLRVVASVHRLLEGAARKAVDQAAPYARGIGWIVVPIEFSLDQENISDPGRF